jgi:phage shock protein E
VNREPMRTNLPFVAVTGVFGLVIMALAAIAAPPARAQGQPDYVDYAGFLELGSEVAAYRESRLIDLDTFNAMKNDPDTLIIDARSAGNYAIGHIDGAVNLNFADFTDAMLAEVIGAKDRRILIYCNNNFSDDIAPIVLKRVELALNIPTFINLYGYGYQNIYELSGAHSIHDPAINWVAQPIYQQN